jgi:hypothetical protein
MSGLQWNGTKRRVPRRFLFAAFGLKRDTGKSARPSAAKPQIRFSKS